MERLLEQRLLTFLVAANAIIRQRRRRVTILAKACAALFCGVTSRDSFLLEELSGLPSATNWMKVPAMALEHPDSDLAQTRMPCEQEVRRDYGR
jgi:hypothetical protein